MKDCALKCIKEDKDFAIESVYLVENNKLHSKNGVCYINPIKTIEEINLDFSSKFELVEYNDVALSEIKSKYGSDCYEEIMRIIDKYKAIIPQSEIIETYKSILDIAKDAYSVLNGEVFNEDGDFLFEVNKRTYMDCKEHVLKEEIDKYESANR